MKKPIVLLAEDEAMMRQGIKLMLEKMDAASKIYEAVNGQEALIALQQHTVDIVLLDIKMPGKGGVETLREIKKSFPRTRVIIVTGFEGSELVLNVLKEGVHGFVQKLNGLEEILKALTVVAEGGRYFPEAVLHIIQSHADHWDVPPPVHLKEQELKLIRAISLGLTTKEIADEYHMSVRTAETNRQRLMEKTQTRNTAGLLAYAYRNGII